jgi:hypothetical protein
MWRMTPRLAIATLTATLAFALEAAPEAMAATVQSYSYTTFGDISGMTGVQPIEFQGVYNGGTLTTPGSVTLGQFITNPLPATATLTYNDTPFTIDLNVKPMSPANFVPGNNFNTLGYEYVISGVLNGSITGNGISSMMATVTSITGNDFGLGTTPPFPISDLQVIAPQGIVAPNGSIDGVTTLTGQVTVGDPGLPTPAPEPSTIAVFGLALAGWAYRRRSRARA